MPTPSSPGNVEDYFYEALPFVETHPDHLGAISVLFGLRSAPPERFRLLEIGTATGGNILPMAATFPACRFVALDRSEPSLQAARKVAEAAELGNVVLHLADVRDFQDEPASFDYIVCHGVYSWMPDDARAAVRRLIRTHLAPGGVAYISFNTLPGWHLRGGVRDMLRREVRGIASHTERIAKGRALLEFLATNFESTDSSRLWLTNELSILAEMSDHYLLGEHLVDHNRAEYFEDFARDMTADGLTFVADAHVPLVFPDRLGTEAAEAVWARGGDMVSVQQSLDLLELRCFRRAVLCRDDAPLDRRVSASRLATLAVASRLEPTADEPDFTEGVEQGFEGRTGVIATNQAPLKAAFVALAAEAPRAIAFEVLAARVAELLGLDVLDAAARGRLSRNLLGLYKKGAIDLWATEKPIASRPTASPTAFVFARHQARLGSPFCTTLLHEAVQTDSFDRALIKRMDGTLDMSALVQAVVDDARAGIVSVEMNGTACVDRDVFDEIAERKVAMFAKRGLFVG